VEENRCNLTLKGLNNKKGMETWMLVMIILAILLLIFVLFWYGGLNSKMNVLLEKISGWL